MGSFWLLPLHLSCEGVCVCFLFYIPVLLYVINHLIFTLFIVCMCVCMSVHVCMCACACVCVCSFSYQLTHFQLSCLSGRLPQCFFFSLLLVLFFSISTPAPDDVGHLCLVSVPSSPTLWGSQDSPPLHANAEPLPVVIGPGPYDLGERDRCRATHVGGHAPGGAASERPATVHTAVPPA